MHYIMAGKLRIVRGTLIFTPQRLSLWVGKSDFTSFSFFFLTHRQPQQHINHSAPPVVSCSKQTKPEDT